MEVDRQVYWICGCTPTSHSFQLDYSWLLSMCFQQNEKPYNKAQSYDKFFKTCPGKQSILILIKFQFLINF